jgi:D-alanyl-D-alanine carboxypeptidase
VPTYSEKIEMEATAATQYKAMYDAALADGAELIPYSGYRSINRQKNNFDRKISSYVSKGYSRAEAVNLAAMAILPPGCSEHNSGLAMDITRLGVWDIREDFDTTKEFAWLQAHAHDYGFILRYPKDKRNITNVMYEPWHWRYVGIGSATAMKASGQCLEEYLGLTS